MKSFKIKKFLNIILVYFILFTSIPVYATETEIANETATSTITIEKAQGYFYDFYCLMDLTTDGEHYAYKLNKKYKDFLEFDRYFENEESFISYLEMLTEYDDIREFADSVYQFILERNREVEQFYPPDSEDFYERYISPDKEIVNHRYGEDLSCILPQGYYLIVQNFSEGNTDDSLVILDTLGQTNITITEKGGNIPTLTKTVLGEHYDYKYDEYSLDYDKASSYIEYPSCYNHNHNENEHIHVDEGFILFNIDCTISENIKYYDSYTFIVHDKLPEGLTFDHLVSIYIGNKAIDIDSIRCDFRDSYSHCNEEDCTIEFEFDLKQIAHKNNIELNANTNVNIEYTAKLNDNFIMGYENLNGNQNTAFLEFSSNPYHEEYTKFTPMDYATVYAYTLQINKLDEDRQPLTGAEFKLQKKIEMYDYEYGGYYFDYVDMDLFEKNEDGTIFTFNGIGVGEYKIVETKVPIGYNKVDDIEFQIRGEPYDLRILDKDGNVIENIYDIDGTFSIDYDGIISIDIINTTGIKLPSTGSTGAIVIYSISGIATTLCITSFIIAKKKKRR